VPSLILAAQAARAAGLPARALPPLRQAVAQVPDSPEPAFLLCHTLLDLDDPALPAAIAQAAKHHPGQAAEWQALGRALHRAGRAAESLAAFTRAAEADPTLAAAQFGRGLVLRDAGQIRHAQAALQRAVALDPAAANAWFVLGLTCQDLDDEASAAAAFNAALRARPAFPEAAVNLGIALQRQGEMEAAIQAYRTAVRIQPDTFGRIAQAITTAPTGQLCLDPAAFRRLLGA
jgi:tetratricopeptide (TPR) repeat protein